MDGIVTGFERHIEAISLPDPNDRHVVAAAIESHANLIVTFNLSDFPARDISKYGIKAISPDAFIVQLLDVSEPVVCRAVKRLRSSLRKPPKTPEELIDTYERQGLTNSAQRFRNLVHYL